MSGSVDQLVAQALEVFADPTVEADDEVVCRLAASGMDGLVAEKLAVLVPLAFGRVLMAHMGKVELSGKFILIEEGEQVFREFKDEPLFLSAMAIGARLLHGGPRRLFERPATWSPELHCANDLLRAGGSLEGAILTSPIVARLSASQWDAAAI